MPTSILSLRQVATGRSSAPGRFLVRNESKSISFDGSTSYATIPIQIPETSFNIAFWAYIPLFNSSFGRLFDYTDASSYGTRTVLNTAANRFINFDCGNGSFSGVGTGSGHYGPGKWVHLMFIHSSSNTNSIYANNILVNTSASTYKAPVSQTFTLGRKSFASTNFAKFIMRDFVYKPGTVLTSNERLDLYAKNILPSGTTCYITFDNSAVDLTGNGNDATLTNTSYVSFVPMISRSTV